MSITLDELRKVIRDELTKGQKTEESYIHVQNCPDCYQKAIDGLNKRSKFACKTCGLPLGDENFVKKLEVCPNCGDTRVKEVKRNDE